jgi:hypothetical protein
MKKHILVILSFLVVTALLQLTASASGTVPADEITTEYKAGYIIHYMDFSKVNSFGDTGYTLIYSGTNTAKCSVKVEDSVLKIDESDNQKAYIVFTGNDIPSNIQNYVIEYQFAFKKNYVNDRYFCCLLRCILQDGKISSTQDFNFRYNATFSNDGYTGEKSANMIAAIKNGEKITVRIIMQDRLTDTTYITVGNETVEMKKPTLNNINPGLPGFICAANYVEVNYVKITAGYEYDKEIWPGEVSALVKTVGMDALASKETTAPDTTKAPETTNTPVTTKTPTTTKAPDTVKTTEAAITTPAPVTSLPESDAAPADKGGCGSICAAV